MILCDFHRYPYSYFTHLALPPVFTFPPSSLKSILLLISLSDHCVLLVLCPPILCIHLLLASIRKEPLCFTLMRWGGAPRPQSPEEGV